MRMSDFLKKAKGHYFFSIDQDEEDPEIVYVTYTDKTDWYRLNPDVDFDRLKALVFRSYNDLDRISLLMSRNAMILGPNKVDYKQVKCNSCGMSFDIATGNRPNTTCPSCGEGVLEV